MPKNRVTKESFELLQSCVVGELDPNDYEFVDRVELKSLKKGEFFITSLNADKIWQKDEYDKSSKKFLCINVEDNQNWKAIAGKVIVYTGFEY